MHLRTERRVRSGSSTAIAAAVPAPTPYAGSTSISGHIHRARPASARSIADVPSSNPNRRVRSRFTSPERSKFETRAGSAPRNVLNLLTSHNLTKMAVVQLRQRKWPERGPKRPETGLRAAPGGSVYDGAKVGHWSGGAVSLRGRPEGASCTRA